jgi:predicted transcriptional regulator
VETLSTFEGWTTRYRHGEVLELEWALTKGYVVLKDSLFISMGESIIYGPFYDWYCGFSHADPWLYPSLVRATICDSIRAYGFIGMSCSLQQFNGSIKGILEAQKDYPARNEEFITTFLILLFRYTWINQQQKEDLIENLLEIGTIDSTIWSSLLTEDWCLKLIETHNSKIVRNPEIQKNKLIENFTGFLIHIFLPKITERKSVLRLQAKTAKYHFKEELIARSHHPAREIDWCYDEEEKRELEEDFGMSAGEFQRQMKDHCMSFD